MPLYLIEVETVNIFNSNINKIIFFKTAKHAYDYAIKLDPLVKKDNIYSLEKAIKNNIIWESNKNIFPFYKCKIIEMDNDMMWGVYHCEKDKGNLVQSIYKNLKINEVI
jgi:hypothetical protein